MIIVGLCWDWEGEKKKKKRNERPGAGDEGGDGWEGPGRRGKKRGDWDESRLSGDRHRGEERLLTNHNQPRPTTAKLVVVGLGWVAAAL